jgi:large subunit ribosomal protein L13e
VHGQTVKYQAKKKLGRGFTLDELKAAGISAHMAPTIGIAVDHRRRNRSQELLDENAARLKEYKSKLVLFPRRANKPKAGEASAAEAKAATQARGLAVLPYKKAAAATEFVKITEDMKKFSAYGKLRVEKMNVR